MTLNVPQEIVHALESRTFSLHIKGSAGTGKTTMALELMKLFPENCRAVYLSTRVSPERLYEQFPWSKSCIHQENVLDANANLYSDTKQEALFEYVDKPSFLRSLYSKVMDSTGEKPTIIVDSLDALKSNLKIPCDEFSMESDILEISNRLNAKVLFISELSGESKLDYLVDGVVRLEKEIVGGRLLRKLYIEKVRGKRIENPMYLFTLKDGRFTCFEKGIQINFTNQKFSKGEKEKGKKIPSLISELDNILGGGFERGTFNIFDIGDKVGLNHAYVCVPMFLNLVIQGIPVFSIPSKGIFSTDVVKRGPSISLSETFISSLDEGTLKYLSKYFCVILPSSHTTPNKIEMYRTYFLEGKDYKEDINNFIDFASKILDEVQADTLLVTMASDTMEYIYGTNGLLKIIQTWMDRIKQINGIMALFQFGHETLRLQTHLASNYFRIENIGGNIVFYGEIPKTKMYVAALDILKGHIQTRLVPIE
nr:gas vesicle protein GvpD [Candidatus Freyarchaeota archaeon]